MCHHQYFTIHHTLKGVDGEKQYQNYFKANPTHYSGIPNLMEAVLKSLNMAVYYTANEVETRAWYLVISFFSHLISSHLMSIKSSYVIHNLTNHRYSNTRVLPGGSSVLTAARNISADMERLFNFADVMTYGDFREVDGDIDSMRVDKKLRPQGKRYLICDGDIIDIKVKKK